MDMATNNPIRHVYELTRVYKTVRHYKLDRVINGNPQLSNLINLSENRYFTKATDRKYMLQVRSKDGKRWIKPILTGLKPTVKPLRYEGDISRIEQGKRYKKHLLIFIFRDNTKTLVIDLYPNHYTNRG